MVPEQSVEVQRYLQELDAALATVPFGTAIEVRAGIAEELASLDRDAARARIAQLGDPATIAEAALGDSSSVPARRVPALESRGYIVMASLAVTVGIFVVPIIGALVGFVLVWVSPAWKRWEKIVATAIPVVAGLVAAMIGAWRRLGNVVVSVEPSTGEFYGPSAGDFISTWPEVFSSPFVWLDAYTVVLAANVVVGIWLLIRALRRA